MTFGGTQKMTVVKNQKVPIMYKQVLQAISTILDANFNKLK